MKNMEIVEYEFKKYYVEDFRDFLRDFWNESEFEGNIYYEYERRKYGRTEAYCKTFLPKIGKLEKIILRSFPEIYIHNYGVIDHDIEFVGDEGKIHCGRNFYWGYKGGGPGDFHTLLELLGLDITYDEIANIPQELKEPFEIHLKEKKKCFIENPDDHWIWMYTKGSINYCRQNLSKIGKINKVVLSIPPDITWGYEGTKIIGEGGIILCFGFGWGLDYFKSRALFWLLKTLGLDVDMDYIIKLPKPDISVPFTPIIIDIPEETIIEKVMGIPDCPSCESSRVHFQSATNKCRCKRCGSIFTKNGKLINKRELPACPECWNVYTVSYNIANGRYHCCKCDIKF